MKKIVVFLCLVLTLLSGGTAYAAESCQIGVASTESTSIAMKWTTFGVAGSLIGAVFGLIYKMADSDPIVFGHGNCLDNSICIDCLLSPNFCSSQLCIDECACLRITCGH